MKIELLKSIAGAGDFVEGSAGHFSLAEGEQAEVEDAIAEKWIASGIAKPADETRAAETAMLAKPAGKPRKAHK